MEVYLPLACLVHAERTAVVRVAREASQAVASMKELAPEKHLEAVVALAREVSEVSLSTVGDCGGVSTYVQFYQAMRDVWGTQRLVDDLHSRTK